MKITVHGWGTRLWLAATLDLEVEKDPMVSHWTPTERSQP
jgi:hypothetical protein